MRKIIAISIFLVVLTCSGCSMLPTGNIAEGVYFNNINVSGKTLAETKHIVEQYFANAPKEITLIDQKGNLETYPLKDLGIIPDIDRTLLQLQSYGYENDLFSMIKNRWNSLFTPVHFYSVYTINPTMEQAFFKNYSIDIGMPRPEARLDVQDGKVIFIEPEKGQIIDISKTMNLIIKAIQNQSKDPIKVQFIEGIPEASNARELKNINTVLGTYTSYFNTGAISRSHNIGLATEKINGVVVPPGGTFSYNSIVGERTAAAGYEAAPVFVGNKLVPGIGGGICQVSSTLFNAALYAGMDIVERTNHFEPVHYMPVGQDATVSYGTLDFSFRNPYSSSIYVLTHLHGGELTVYLLGSENIKPQSVSVNAIESHIIPNKVTEKVDKTVNGEKVEEEGHNGLYVKTQRVITYADGSTKVDTYDSDYDPVDRIVLKGESKKNNKNNKNKESLSNKSTENRSNQIKNNEIHHVEIHKGVELQPTEDRDSERSKDNVNKRNL